MRSITNNIHCAYNHNIEARAKTLHNYCTPEICNKQIERYLDIGSGKGYNTAIFGKTAQEIVGLDIKQPQKTILKNLKTPIF